MTNHTVKKVKDITFHYTNEQMVKDLIALLPFKKNDCVHDAGSGKNKVWYKNIPKICIPSESEIEDGENFHDEKSQYDWVIGNPPYHESWKFTEHAIKIAQKGIAWLVNNQALNSHFTPRRLQMMKDAGFELQYIHVVSDKRWFGRYYFIIFKKQKGIISWERKTY